jgi:general secretion pathway protein G
VGPILRSGWGVVGPTLRSASSGLKPGSTGQIQKHLTMDQSMAKRRNRVSDKGFMLIELIAAITILLVLTTMALPLARNQILRGREVILHEDLRMMRDAVDRYKLDSDQGKIPIKVDSFGYPPDLQTLVDGVPVKGTAKGKYKYLRKIPLDPMTGSADWGLRAMQDDPDSKSWGGQNVFDVYSKSQGTALDGTQYADW